MNPERLKRIEELYLKASALPPEQRAEFLSKECEGDTPLRSELESLLSREKEAESFLESPICQKQTQPDLEARKQDLDTLTGRALDRYQVHERIGVGGMGVVYRAFDTKLGRTVALKVLPEDLTIDAERKNRFVREAKAASALNHQNIITVFDIDSVAGVEFIAMEYIPGRTLQEIITSGELAIPDVLNLATQIVQALVAAHAAGIVHRDIKPANMMVTGLSGGPYQLKVLDFGLAKLTVSDFSDDTLSQDMTGNSIIGTAAYMSPEQAEGKLIDARSDIFSFGIVLYEMLSGHKPFSGESNLAVLSAVLRESPKPIQGIPASLQTVVSNCLEKDPGGRFRSAIELKIALESCASSSTPSQRTLKTIAVLPFANLSTDKENEYFSDGLTEETISALTRLPGLRVTARTSAFALRDRNLDAREIGAKLNVEHILEGSVRRSGNRVRVTAQVVNVEDGYQLWSERYDREMRDILDIQDEISRAIVETLRVHLTKDLSPVRRHTKNSEAYSLYLRGHYYQEKHTLEGYLKAKECFEQALDADPQYTLAMLGLAEVYWQNAFYGFRKPKEVLASAKEAVARALDINDELPEGHALLGTMLGVVDWNWSAAGNSFRRALELDANSPYVLFRYANYYLWPKGQAEEALALVERALSFDPLWVLGNWVFAYYLYAMRQYDRAAKHLNALIEMDPEFHLAYCVLGLAYVQQGKNSEAVSLLEKACKLSPENPFTLGMLAYGFGRAGEAQRTENIIDKLKVAEQKTYVAAKSLMFAWAGLSDSAKVLAYAEKSLDDRDPMTIMCLLKEPSFDFVRLSPDFSALLRKINLYSESGRNRQSIDTV